MDMATYNPSTDIRDPQDNIAAYVCKEGASVSGNQVHNSHLVSKFAYRKAAQSSRGENGAAQCFHGGALL